MPIAEEQKLDFFGQSLEDPFAEENLDALQEMEPAAADDNVGQLAVDVFEDQANIYVKATIAGCKPEDLDIALQDDILTITGSRQQQETIDRPKIFYQECYWGKFSRSLPLPARVESDKISAVLKDGVLTITLPKAEY